MTKRKGSDKMGHATQAKQTGGSYLPCVQLPSNFYMQIDLTKYNTLAVEQGETIFDFFANFGKLAVLLVSFKSKRHFFCGQNDTQLSSYFQNNNRGLCKTSKNKK